MSADARAHVIARPLRFGFLLRPGAKADLREAVTTANMQWGGRWSSMVPMYSKRPARWTLEFRRPVPGPEIAPNIIDVFDPDFLVRPDDLEVPSELHGRQVLTHADLRAGKFAGIYPEYGIGWLEVLQTLYKSEFQYKKAFPFRICLPTPPRKDATFWEMVLGSIPEAGATDEIAELTDATRPDVDFENVLDVLMGEAALPADLLDHGVEAYGGNRPTGPHLYLHDHRDWTDLVDLWNLRALGVRLLPVPIACIDNDGLESVAKWVVARSGDTDRHVTVLRGRSIRPDAMDTFFARLREIAGQREGPLGVRQGFPVPYWEPWRRQRDCITSPQISAGRAWRDLAAASDSRGHLQVDVQLVAPPVGQFDRAGRVAAFANDVEMHLYGADPAIARVLPAGDRRFTRSVHYLLTRGGRATHGPLVVFGTHDDANVTLDLARSDQVLSAWLAARDIEATPSDPGRHISAMLARLDHWGLWLLASRPFLDLIRKHAGVPGAIPAGRMRRVAEGSAVDGQAPDNWTKRLTDRGILAVGLQVKCPTCGRKPWYGLDQLASELVCSFCHGPFAVTQHTKPGDWAYRLVGPFNVKDDAISGACVLLVMRLLGKLFGSHGDDHISAYPGMDVVIGGDSFEIDLVGLLKQSQTRERAVPLFVEAKAGTRIQDKDIERMELVARRFPDSLVVFATLAGGFDDQAVSRLVRLVRRLERWGRRGRGARVLVLGGSDLLFNDRVGSDFFEDMGMNNGRSALQWRGSWADLCLASQRLHLSRPGW